MTFFLVSSIPFVYYSLSSFSLVVVLVSFWVVFLSSTSMFSNQSYSFLYLNDEVSLFMLFMTVFVLYVSYIYSLSFKSYYKMNMVFIFMLIFCFGAFTTNNLFLLYFFYECSLLPILYIIIKWGSYPERSLSAMMLLIYTSIFTFPFIMVMFSFYGLQGSFLLTDSILSNCSTLGVLSTFIIFSTFAVKLPVYGLHFWLPMAHVEAPTFGSMILAGILLKLGGVGLLRCSKFMDMGMLGAIFMAYFTVFMLYVTVVCLFQSDFKRLVAYSSVSHMMAIPILLLVNNLMSTKSLVMLMLFHGLSSPLLFMLVGIVYSMFSSRQLIMIRGLLLSSPLISFVMVLAFFFTLSAPPFPSFVSEVYFLVSSLCYSSYFIYVFCVFTFLSLLYNLNWLSAMVFSSATPSNMSTSLSYMSFMPLFMSILLCVPMSLLMFLL
uniref:NADH-ubiquinone oxidoreductase chain 4 n=1 Tax=Brachionus rubens TaxID=392764 RepID=A0A0C4L153_9BILA|nr:NADH dehydrogenase subunit 4 [Brachionus rubens]